MKTQMFTLDEMLIARADAFAAGAHCAIKQKRKYTGEPYIVHPREVAEIVNKIPGRTIEMIMASLTHDTVEDTGVEIQDIQAIFGPNVANLVNGLTDVSKPQDGNRKARKQLDLVHLSLQNTQVMDIRMADCYCNILSIVELDPKFAREYLVEKAHMLPILKSGNPDLWNQLQMLITNSAEKLCVKLP